MCIYDLEFSKTNNGGTLGIPDDFAGEKKKEAYPWKSLNPVSCLRSAVKKSIMRSVFYNKLLHRPSVENHASENENGRFSIWDKLARTGLGLISLSFSFEVIYCRCVNGNTLAHTSRLCERVTCFRRCLILKAADSGGGTE